MIELFKGVFILIASLIVFSFVIAIGLIYTVPYSFYLWKESTIDKGVLKGFILGFFTEFIWCWLKRIDGTLFNFGKWLGEGAVRYDKIGNVWGEWVEDSTTYQDETPFGDKDTTISASLGFLEYNMIKMYKRGKTLSLVLNGFFMQKKHTVGSWLVKIKQDEIEEADYYETKKKQK